MQFTLWQQTDATIHIYDPRNMQHATPITPHGTAPALHSWDQCQCRVHPVD